MQEFKDEPGFSTSHLAEGSRHHDWLQRARSLNDSLPPKDEIGSDVHALPGWLIAAGFDLSGEPQGTQWKSSIEERFIEYQLPIAKKSVEIEP